MEINKKNIKQIYFPMELIEINIYIYMINKINLNTFLFNFWLKVLETYHKLIKYLFF